MLERPIAVFSDVHANLEALEAVQAQMDAHALSTRICLGDTVGYGPDPSACLEMVRALNCPVIQGNHDEAAAGEEDLNEMGGLARLGIHFARKQLSDEQRDYLRALPLVHATKTCQYVHASLDTPEHWGYVLSAWDAMTHFQAQTHRLSFCGHSHVPRVWHFSEEGDISTWPGEGRVELPATGKILINVGSVGQPRDHNPAACFVVVGRRGRWVQFCRVEYDVAETRRKILAAGLPAYAAERLLHGK